MKNPNENIRAAYITAFAGIGVPVWAKKVPKDTIPVPKQYVLISSQSKNPTEVDKDSREWLCTITFDITSILEPGYSKPVILDDIEEKITTIVESEVPIEDFVNKETIFIDSIDLGDETPSQTIERRVIVYQNWVNNVD